MVAATRDGEITALQLGAAVAESEIIQAAAEKPEQEAAPMPPAGPDKPAELGPAAKKPDQESPPPTGSKDNVMPPQLPATPSAGEALARRPSAVMMSVRGLLYAQWPPPASLQALLSCRLLHARKPCSAALLLHSYKPY